MQTRHLHRANRAFTPHRQDTYTMQIGYLRHANRALTYKPHRNDLLANRAPHRNNHKVRDSIQENHRKAL